MRKETRTAFFELQEAIVKAEVEAEHGLEFEVQTVLANINDKLAAILDADYRQDLAEVQEALAAMPELPLTRKIASDKKNPHSIFELSNS